MSPQEFAQKIREKYPGAYDSVDDNTLTQKVIEKYPIYKDKVKFESSEDPEEGQLNTEDPEDAPTNPKPWESRAIGWTKGLTEAPIETASALQKGGQFLLAALDPTKNFEQIKSETGIESLNDEKLNEIRELLKSENKEEVQGKIVEFIAEMFWPVSKTSEVASLTNKGKKIMGEGVEVGIEKGKSFIDKSLDAAKEIPGKIKTKITGIIPKEGEEKVVEDALNIVRGKLDSGAEEFAAKEGRMSTAGSTKKVIIKPTKQEEKLIDPIMNMVRDGELNPNALPFENIPRLSQEVSRIDQGVEQMIYERKFPFNMNQLKSKLKAVKGDSKIVFTTDPTLERTYDALIDAFMEHVNKGDTLGLFKARKEFDKIPAVKKLLDGMKGAQGENLRRQAVLDIRRAANEYISDLLPDNDPYKAMLKQETQLLEVIDNLAERSKGLVGTTEFSRFIDNNPTMKTVLKNVIPFGMGGLAF